MENQEVFFEVGMKVFDIRFGEGIVTSLDASSLYPIRANFGDKKEEYSTDGKLSNNDNYPCLFHIEPTVMPNQPIIEFEAGEKVWVRASGEWIFRYYSHKESSYHWVFRNQTKSGAVNAYSIVRKFEDYPE